MQVGSNIFEASNSLWLAASKPPEKPRGQKQSKKIEHLTYPELEEAAKFVSDQFWADIIRRAARGKFPRGFVYENRVLKHKQTNISILLPSDPEALALTMIYFFRENGKIHSSRDQEYFRLKQEEELAKISEVKDWDWFSQSKNRRSVYIREYVERKYANLPNSIQNELCVQIEIGLDTKFIGKDHIRIENGRLVNIDGIDANDTEVYFTRAIPEFNLSLVENSPEPKDQIHLHYDNWLKYLKNYKKYLTNSGKPDNSIIQASKELLTLE